MEVLLGFLRGGDGAAGGMSSVGHWGEGETRLTVVAVVDLVMIASLLFWRAIFRRFERLGFEVNWVFAPRPDNGIAADRDPYTILSTYLFWQG